MGWNIAYVLADDPIELINTAGLRDVVVNALEQYRHENESYADAEVVDLLVVGSVADEDRDFIPNTSDLDIIVSLRGTTAQKTVLHGFAVFLRETRADELRQASNLPVTGVDIGVYDSSALTEHIDDPFAFSCNRRAVTPVSMLQE